MYNTQTIYENVIFNASVVQTSYSRKILSTHLMSDVCSFRIRLNFVFNLLIFGTTYTNPLFSSGTVDYKIVYSILAKTLIDSKSCKRNRPRTAVFRCLTSRLFFRRRDEKSKEDHPRSDLIVAVGRHVGLRRRGVGVDADVAILRSGLRTTCKTRVENFFFSVRLFFIYRSISLCISPFLFIFFQLSLSVSFSLTLYFYLFLLQKYCVCEYFVFFCRFPQNPDAPLSVIYENLGMPVIKYMVTGGAIFALFTS